MAEFTITIDEAQLKDLIDDKLRDDFNLFANEWVVESLNEYDPTNETHCHIGKAVHNAIVRTVELHFGEMIRRATREAVQDVFADVSGFLAGNVPTEPKKVPSDTACPKCGHTPAYTPPDFPCDHMVEPDVYARITRPIRGRVGEPRPAGADPTQSDDGMGRDLHGRSQR